MVTICRQLKKPSAFDQFFKSFFVLLLVGASKSFKKSQAIFERLPIKKALKKECHQIKICFVYSSDLALLKVVLTLPLCPPSPTRQMYKFILVLQCIFLRTFGIIENKYSPLHMFSIASLLKTCGGLSEGSHTYAKSGKVILLQKEKI